VWLMTERPQTDLRTMSGVSNKPMVPTAHTWPAGSPMNPVRRHLGRLLGRFGRRREVSQEAQGRARIGLVADDRTRGALVLVRSKGMMG